MTRDRKHKTEARARQAQRGGTYFAARTATAQPGSAFRRRNALANLSATPETVVDALSRLCGLRPPSGPIGARLVDSVLAMLETAPPRPPLGPRWGEISLTLEGRETIDSVPESIRAAARAIKRLLALLDDEQLVTAATELGLRESTINVAAIWVVKRSERNKKRSKSRASEDDYYDQLPVVGEDDAEYERAEATVRRARANAVRRLRHRANWHAGDNEVLRHALAEHLGRLGEAYLTATEERLKPLAWRRQPDGTLRADAPINGAPLPLSAVVKENVRHRGDPTSSPEFYRPDRRQSTIGYVCHVGVIHSAANVFDMFDEDGHLPSTEAAKLEGARMVARIAADPCRYRGMFSNRPLVPRTADTSDDEYTLTFNFGMALRAIVAGYNESADDPEEWLWSARPHVTADLQLNTITARALDEFGLPWPRPDERACDQPVGSTAFQEYLATQGVRMTAIARCYLTGTDDVGAGGQFLVDRHAAGMAAVFAAHEFSAVIGELAEEYPATAAWSKAVVPGPMERQLGELGALSTMLTDLVRAEAGPKWWETYDELYVVDHLDTYPWVVWSLKVLDPQGVLQGVDIDAHTRTAMIDQAAESGGVFEDAIASEEFDGTRYYEWYFGIKHSEHLSREPAGLQPIVLAEYWATLLLLLPTEFDDPELWTCGPSTIRTHKLNEFDGGYSANQIARAYR